jgi:hypothetical protein
MRTCVCIVCVRVCVCGVTIYLFQDFGLFDLYIIMNTHAHTGNQRAGTHLYVHALSDMYPPPHMTYMYPPPHMTYMHPPPHTLRAHTLSFTHYAHANLSHSRRGYTNSIFIYLFIYYTGYTNLGAAFPGAKNNPIPGREGEGEQGSQAGPPAQVCPSPPPPRAISPFPRPLSLSPILSLHH